MPQALEDQGGWPNRDMAKYFGEYCEIVVKELGDRANDWCIFVRDAGIFVGNTRARPKGF